MKRRWFMIIGIFVVAFSSVLLLAFGFQSLTEPATAPLPIGMALAGLMFVLGGYDRQLGGIEWYQFVGAGNVLCGISFILGQLVPVLSGTSGYSSSAHPFLVVAATAGGASIIIIGADWMRGGHHFDLSVFRPGPILPSEK